MGLGLLEHSQIIFLRPVNMPESLIKCTGALSGSQLAVSLITHHVLMHEGLIASHLKQLFSAVILFFRK